MVKDNGDGTYDVTYHPPPEGSMCMPRVTLAGRDIKDRSVIGRRRGAEWVTVTTIILDLWGTCDDQGRCIDSLLDLV